MLEFSVPDQLGDLAPPFATNLDGCRHKALHWLSAHDYQLVMPPLADYIETLTGEDEDLNINTFKMTDTLTGRTLGVRADQTPQIARFDANLGDKEEVRRYCYCGPALRVNPLQQWQGRESMQLGAELFGAPAGAGDWEIASIALGALRAMGIDDVCIDLGHAGLFAVAAKDLTAEQRHLITGLVSRRDAAGIEALAANGKISAQSGRWLLGLVKKGASDEVLAAAAEILPAPAQAALTTLAAVRQQLQTEAYDSEINLSDLGSYGYHSGIVFTIYGKDRVLARGGRYRYRTGSEGVGFSIDLRTICDLVPPPSPTPPLNIPLAKGDRQWWDAVARLRTSGRRLRFFHTVEGAGQEPPLPALRFKEGKWSVQEL